VEDFDVNAGPFLTAFGGEVVAMKTVGTGLSFEIPEGYEMQIRPRSGLTRDGFIAQFGTIDSDYRGEVGILLMCLKSRKFKAGERIAQGVIKPVERVNIEVAEELSETVRGPRGFGSTKT
jgi:dUTP pyrophosphatase